MTNTGVNLPCKNSISNNKQNQKQNTLPKRIILVRHGETQVNEDETVLEYVPNHKIKLSKKGRHQARKTGSKIRELIASDDQNMSDWNWKVFFYVSPSSRTRETMEEIIETLPKEKVVGVREECRLREQHFGNFQEMETRKKMKRMRNRYGKFFYRVPDGESSADVHDRVSAFLEGGLWRDMETGGGAPESEELNLIVVSHGLTILIFLMKWFKWSVDEFEGLTNPPNCEYRVIELGRNGEYSLAVHHQDEELREWGLSQEMIEDQKLRAYGPGFLFESETLMRNVQNRCSCNF